MIDASEFEKHADAMLKGMGPKLESLGRRMRARLTRRFRGHIAPKGGTPGRKVSGSRIGNRSKAIWDALEQGKKGSLTEMTVTLDGLELTTGVDRDLVPYLIAHELGATIKPKRAGALTVPVSQEAVDALEAAGGNIRSLDLFVIPTRKGLLALAKKAGDSVRVMFLLLKQVIIPKRPVIEPGVEDFANADLPEFADDLGEDIIEAWEST